jgi:SAM-dependent methyltransferase
MTSPFSDGALYDLILEDLDYCKDFYVSEAKASPGPVLEIACGTGRITLPILTAGVNVEGMDLFAPMLERLREKAAAKGFAPTLHQGDMARFQLPRQYALILITFNAYINMLTQEDQLSCLRCCKDHLLPGGKLVFDTFFPGLHIVGAPQHTRVLEMERPHPVTGKLLRCYDTRSFDRVKQTQHSINELEEVQDDGSIKVLQRAEFTTRYVYREEMILLLRLAGFTRWNISGDFAGKQLTDETDAMIVEAW